MEFTESLSFDQNTAATTSPITEAASMSGIVHASNHTFVKLPFENSTFKKTDTEGLVHCRLQQLVYEWLLLPQTAALVRHLQKGTRLTNDVQTVCSSIDYFDSSKDIPPGSPFHKNDSSELNHRNQIQRSRASPLGSSFANTSISRTSTPAPSDSFSLLPALGDEFQKDPSPSHSQGPSLLPTAIDFNSALCSPIHPPRSPARRGPTQPGPRSERYITDPGCLPPSDVDYTTTGSPGAPISPRPTVGASTALVGALLKTAASAAEAVKSDGDTHMGDSSLISTSAPISALVSAGVQQLESLDLSGMDIRLAKLNAALDCSTTDLARWESPFVQQHNQPLEPSTLPILDEKKIHQALQKTSVISGDSESEVLQRVEPKERRSRQDDSVILSTEAKRQKPSPIQKQEETPIQSTPLELPVAQQLQSSTTSQLTTTVPTTLISPKIAPHSEIQFLEIASSGRKSTPISVPHVTKMPDLADTLIIPQFFHSKYLIPQDQIDEKTLNAINGVFENLPQSESTDLPNTMDLATFESRVVVDLLRMSKFFSEPVFDKIDTTKRGYITKDMFWKGRLVLNDDTNNFFHLIRQDDFDFLWGHDFEPFIQAILDRHPGMEFLKETAEFQKRYTTTVIARLLYLLDPHASGKVTLNELRRFDRRQKLTAMEHSDISLTPFPTSLVEIWKGLDSSPDLNHERLFFSYEHFYVIYCTFWELDANHDFQLDKQDFLKYDSHALSARTINRIIFRLSTCNGSNALLSYDQFVVFLMNDEDKTTDRSLEFWFDIVDLDGDGYIRYYEMQYFYEEQCQRLDALNHEVVPFSDILCQMNDFLKPRVSAVFTLADFKRNRKTSGVFFDILLSLTKFVAYEVRDPFQLKQELTDFPDFSTWDRFCRREYDKLAVEEGEDEEDEDSRDGEWGDAMNIPQDEPPADEEGDGNDQLIGCVDNNNTTTTEGTSDPKKNDDHDTILQSPLQMVSASCGI